MYFYLNQYILNWVWSKLTSYKSSKPISTLFSNNHDYSLFMFFDFFSFYLIFPSIKHPHSLFSFLIKYVPLQLFIHYAQFEYLLLFYCFYRLCLESVYPLQRSTTSVFVCIFFPLFPIHTNFTHSIFTILIRFLFSTSTLRSRYWSWRKTHCHKVCHCSK